MIKRFFTFLFLKALLGKKEEDAQLELNEDGRLELATLMQATYEENGQFIGFAEQAKLQKAVDLINAELEKEGAQDA